MKRYFSISVICRLAVSILLFWALGRHRYAYYILLRWVVCGTGLYSMLVAFSVEKKLWVGAFVIICILFNPLASVHFSRDTWAVIDIATAIIFILSTFFVQEGTNSLPWRVRGCVGDHSRPKEKVSKSIICHHCNGHGELKINRKRTAKGTSCPHCLGTGWIDQE